MTALLLAAAFACGAALPAMAEQATPETAAQPDPTEWADEAQDVTETEEAPVYQQADAQEVATGGNRSITDRYGSRLHGTVY